MDDRLAVIAAELYSGPLTEFTALRNARANTVDDRELAVAIRALRKPSVAAWVVNVFASERSEELGQALHLAEELREAQADLDAPALAKLGRERRALTLKLAAHATACAEQRGEKVTPGTREAVQNTISAAFFDAGAALAVSSGRLVRELVSTGGVSIDPAEVVAGGAEVTVARVATLPDDELAARRRRRGAERAVADAVSALSAVRREQETANKAMQDTAHRVDVLSATAADLERQLVGVRRELELASQARERSRERAESAAALIAAAAKRVEDAQIALDAL